MKLLWLAVPIVVMLALVPGFASARGGYQRRGYQKPPVVTPIPTSTPTATPTATIPQVDPFAFAYNPSGRPYFVPSDAVKKAVTGWNGISLNVTLTYSTTSGKANCGAADGVNTISWERNSKPGVIALTCSFASGESDIKISPDYPGVDIQTVVQHEVGHAIGLQHGSDPGAVMYYKYSSHGPLPGPQAEDIEQLCNRYQGCVADVVVTEMLALD